MTNDTMTKRLTHLRNLSGKSQREIADLLGISGSAYNYYESGRSYPPIDTIVKLANYYNVTTDYILGHTDARTPEEYVSSNEEINPARSNKNVTIQVLGQIPAGVPTTAVEYVIDTIKITIPMSDDTDKYFGLKVTGDSMKPTIKDGDIVVVRKQDIVDNNRIAVVLINGEDATLKRVRKSNNGLALYPDNPEYEVRIFTAEEVNNLPVMILGEVIELRREI